MKLSVVVPVVGKVDITRRCLESVRRYSTLAPEIVVVDNGSTLHEAMELSRMKPDVLLAYPVMLGYPKAVNLGVRGSCGEFVCLLNNDAEVTQDGWDARLVSALEHVERAAIVAPVTNYTCSSDQRASEPSTDYDRLIETTWIPFICVIMRRSLFDGMGGLDEGYGMGNWEDADFCRRVYVSGGKVLIDPAVFVRHAGNQTMIELPFYGNLLMENRQRFEKKWGAAHAH